MSMSKMVIGIAPFCQFYLFAMKKLVFKLSVYPSRDGSPKNLSSFEFLSYLKNVGTQNQYKSTSSPWFG